MMMLEVLCVECGKPILIDKYFFNAAQGSIGANVLNFQVGKDTVRVQERGYGCSPECFKKWLEKFLTIPIEKNEGIQA
jgi:hypothetical protein